MRLPASMFGSVLMAGLTGCATFGQPSYCKPMLDSNREVMAGKSDLDISYIAMALAKLEFGGQCACPDDKDEEGNICGARSAHSRFGGAQPYCYAEEVPQWVLPRVREASAFEALPFECGGAGATGLLTF